MKMFEIEESQNPIDMNKVCLYLDNLELNIEIKEAIKKIFGVASSCNDKDIHLSFDDFKKIMSHGEVVFSGIGEYVHENNNSLEEAIKLSLQDISLDYSEINKALGILMHFEIHPDFPLVAIAEGLEIIYDNADENADIIWGTTTNSAVSENYVKVRILISGFQKKNYKNTPINNYETT
jgi:cell division protein FtsZ